MTSKAFRDRLARRAKSVGVSVATDVVDSLEVYIRLLARWNAKVNLTSLPLEDPTDETFDRLLIEPLVAARTVDDSWTPWFDVGSGGGSPAIPLKLAKPALRLTMVESKARKAAFLREVVRELGLSDTTVETRRFEELVTPGVEGEAGLATVRAVRADPKLVKSLSALLRPDARLLMFRPTPVGEKLTGFTDATSTALLASSARLAYLLTYKRRVNS